MKPLPYVLFSALALPFASLAQVTLSPLSTFGGGDGWLSPGEGGYAFLGTGNLERGIAYGNNQLYLVSRAGGNNVRMLNAATGVDQGGLDVTGIAGGTFAVNMAGVGGDGAIYVGNLATGGGNFKVYRWANDAAVPTVAYDANPGMPRLGDAFALTGSGADTLIAASGTGSSGFLTVNPTAGTGTAVTVPGTAVGDYRLGLTFVNDETLVGTQGGSWKLTEFDGANGTLLLSLPTTSASERLLAYNVVGGVPLLATLDTVSSLVRIYEVSNPLAPALWASATTTSGELTANGNGVGSMAWGQDANGTATLYAMSANQGIQAFTVVVPEPETYALAALGLGALMLFLRRR